MVKKFFLVIIFNTAVCLFSSNVVSGKVQAFFAPHALPVIVRLIDAETKRIRFAYYTFTSSLIKDALIRASQRGVDVEGIVDPYTATANNNRIKELVSGKVKLLQYANRGLMHHKFTLFEESQDPYDDCMRSFVQTGSSNMTNAAHLENCENIIVISDVAVYQKYLQEFIRVKQECVLLKTVPR